jgi:hypothetical protein
MLALRSFGSRKVKSARPSVGGGLLDVVDVLLHSGKAEHVLGHALAPGAAALRAGEHLVELPRRLRQARYRRTELPEILPPLRLQPLQVLPHRFQPFAHSRQRLVNQRLFAVQLRGCGVGEPLSAALQHVQQSAAVGVQRLGRQGRERLPQLLLSRAAVGGEDNVYHSRAHHHARDEN